MFSHYDDVLVTGIRRPKALKDLKWKHKIPRCVVDLDDKEARIWVLTENLPRGSLTVIEEGNAYAEFLRFDINQEDIPSYAYLVPLERQFESFIRYRG